MANFSPNISIITLPVNGLNIPNKRYRLAEWIKKHASTTCCLQETHLKYEDIGRLKVKGCKNIKHSNIYQKKVIVTILMSYKIDFRTKNNTRDRDQYNIMLKWLNYLKT